MSKKHFLFLLFFSLLFVLVLDAGATSTYTKTASNYVGDNAGCWFCGIFETLLGAMDSMADAVCKNLAETFIKILSLLMFAYLLWKVGQAVISFNPINGVEFAKDLLMPMLRAIVAVLLLQSAMMSAFFKQVVSPMAELALGFGIEVQNAGYKENDMDGGVTIIQGGGRDSVTTTPVCEMNDSITSSKIISADFQRAILCFLKNVSSSLVNFMAIGATFMSDCFKYGKWGIIPNFTMFGVGLVYFLGAFILFLSFPFKLLDTMFELMFVLTLLPLWVVLWVVPFTQDKSKKALDMFVGVLVKFICFSVVLVMVFKVLTAALVFTPPATAGKFFSLMRNDQSKKALDMIDWSKSGFWMTVAMFFMANSLLGKADSFAGQFGGSGGLGIGAALGGLAGRGAQKLGDKVGKPVAKATAARFGRGVSNIWTLTGGRGLSKKVAEGSKAAAQKAFYGGARNLGRLYGATGAALKGLNDGPKMSASQAMTPTGMVPNVAGTTKKGTPPVNPKKAKVDTTTKTEKLPDGRTKDTKKSTFKDDQGRRTHEEEKVTVKDKNGNPESRTVTRSDFDAKTQELKQKIRSVESNYDAATGRFTQKTITLEDSLGNVKARLEKTAKGIKKTTYDDKGRPKTVEERTTTGTQKIEYEEGKEKKITMKDNSGNKTVQENTFDSTGRQTGTKTTEYDSNNLKKSTVEDNATGTIKTQYDAQERESVVTMTDKTTGITSVETNSYGADGKRSGFTSVVKNARGEVMEDYSVDLGRNIKKDNITGKETLYKKP